MKKIMGLVFALVAILIFSNCIMYSPSGEPGGYSGPYDQPQGPSNTPPGAYGQDYGYGSSMDISYFYDYLSDFGRWVYYPGYDYVWIPDNMTWGWHPYSHGRWVWTDWGWTWISYFSWGWIPFHYGRWVWEPDFGWFWVPDTIWGPAWVSWRYGSSWIGWAPLPPRYHYARGHGLFLTSIDLADDCWLFVDIYHFDVDNIMRYVLPPERNAICIRTTVFKAQLEEREGRLINDGLSLNEAERITHRRFSTYRIEDLKSLQSTRISSDRLLIYRPGVSALSSAKPRSFVTKDEVSREMSVEGTRHIKRFQGTPPSEIQMKDLQTFQSQEMTTLQQDHQRQIANTQDRYSRIISTAKTPDVRNRLTVQRDLEIKSLKDRHVEEDAALKKRHQDDITRVQTTRGKKH